MESDGVSAGVGPALAALGTAVIGVPAPEETPLTQDALGVQPAPAKPLTNADAGGGAAGVPAGVPDLDTATGGGPAPAHRPPSPCAGALTFGKPVRPNWAALPMAEERPLACALGDAVALRVGVLALTASSRLEPLRSAEPIPVPSAALPISGAQWRPMTLLLMGGGAETNAAAECEVIKGIAGVEQDDLGDKTLLGGMELCRCTAKLLELRGQAAPENCNEEDEELDRGIDQELDLCMAAVGITLMDGDVLRGICKLLPIGGSDPERLSAVRPPSPGATLDSEPQDAAEDTAERPDDGAGCVVGAPSAGPWT